MVAIAEDVVQVVNTIKQVVRVDIILGKCYYNIVNGIQPPLRFIFGTSIPCRNARVFAKISIDIICMVCYYNEAVHLKQFFRTKPFALARVFVLC